MNDNLIITTRHAAPLLYPSSHGKISRRSNPMTADTQETINSDRKDRLALIVVLALCAIAVAALFLLIRFSPGSSGVLPPVTPGNVVVNPGDKEEDTEQGSESSKDSESSTGDSDPAADGGTQPGGTTTEQPGDSTGNGGGANSDPHAGQTWHPAWDESVLVRAAWTEYVNHPAVYNTVYHPEIAHWGNRCNQCGAEISGFASQHISESDNCWSYTNNYKFIDSPAWDETVVVSQAWTEEIYHPAEYRNVHHEGYWE